MAPEVSVTLEGVTATTIVDVTVAGHAPVVKTASSTAKRNSVVRALWLDKWTTAFGPEKLVRSVEIGFIKELLAKQKMIGGLCVTSPCTGLYRATLDLR